MDVEGKPILSVQKLQFVYDPMAVMFTPNDLAHKYPLQPKQQILALTNGQIQEGICWRSANVQPQRNAAAPTSAAQQILPAGDRHGPAEHHLLATKPAGHDARSDAAYMGMSVNSFLSAFRRGLQHRGVRARFIGNDQAGAGFISAVSSVANMLVGVLFDYDNNDLGTLSPYDPTSLDQGHRVPQRLSRRHRLRVLQSRPFRRQ